MREPSNRRPAVGVQSSGCYQNARWLPAWESYAQHSTRLVLRGGGLLHELWGLLKSRSW